MHWKPLVIAACFAVTMIGCAVETDDDTPDVNVTHEDRVAPPPAPDQPDVDIGIEDRDTEVDVDADTEPPADQPDAAPADSPDQQPPG